MYGIPAGIMSSLNLCVSSGNVLPRVNMTNNDSFPFERVTTGKTGLVGVAQDVKCTSE